MVENSVNKQDELKKSKETKYKVNCNNIRNDVYRLEFDDEWSNKKDIGKIKFALKNAEDRILIWHKENYGNKREESWNYEDWKKKLIEAMGTKISPTEFLNRKQGRYETPTDFILKLKTDGKDLELEDNLIIGVFKNGLTRNRDFINLSLIGETKITENLITKIKEANMVAEESFRRHLKKKENKEFKKKEDSRDNPKAKSHVNIITQEDMLNNKKDSLYIKNYSFNYILDTGAKDNYVTIKVIEKIGIKPSKLREPLIRRTCIGEKFEIKETIRTKFKYKNTAQEAEFLILPKRNDELIILGTDWMNKSKKENSPVEKINDIERLIDLLCEKGERKVQNYECRIDTEPGKRVVNKPAIIPQAEEELVDEEVRRLLKLGYIRPSTSTWMNKIKPVIKPNGKVRLTTNFISLNNLVILDKYSLPDITEMLYKLKDKMYKTKIDLKDGFYQVPLHKGDSYKTAFRIKNRLYEWTRMPMGFKNSPAVFQRLMDLILEEEIGKSCFVYVDDILVFGKTEEEHDEALRRVLKKLIKAGLVANKEKIEFKKQEINFLGHKLRLNEIVSEIDNGEAIEKLEVLNDIDEVRKFIGTVSYYRKFIENCADKCEPLTRLLRKDYEFVWEDDQKSAFATLKKELLSEKILHQPDFSKTFYLETDASNVGLGAILSQKVGDNKMPIMFASRKLSQTEQNYSISEKEMLAGLWSMEKFVFFLKGREFSWITDHLALKALNEKGEIKSQRIQRWIERIQQFNFKVEYKKGSEIPHVDALSRLSGKETVNIINGSDEEKLAHEIMKLHEKLVHRGAKIITEEYNKKSIIKITEEKCREVLKKCKICKLYNPIRTGEVKKVNAYEVGEKVAFDIIGPIEDKYIITAIDYFTRFGFAKVINSRETTNVLKFLEEVKKNITIKVLVSDSAKENLSKLIEDWCKKNDIKRHLVTPHHHQSNGRIERLNRTILEAVNKQPENDSLKKRVNRAITVYNTVTHSKTNMTPEAAKNPNSWKGLRKRLHEEVVKNNIKLNKKRRIAKFKMNDIVLIKDEIHKYKGQPKFDRLGKVVEVLEYDTYKVRQENGKIIKRHADQLREWEEECLNIFERACCEII